MSYPRDLPLLGWGSNRDIARHSFDPPYPVVTLPFCGVIFPLERVHRDVATAVGVDGGIYFRRCGVGGGHGGEAPTRWIVDGVVGERCVEGQSLPVDGGGSRGRRWRRRRQLQRLYYHFLKSGSNSSILAWAPDPD
jgi:hypothetical protein